MERFFECFEYVVFTFLGIAIGMAGIEIAVFTRASCN